MNKYPLSSVSEVIRGVTFSKAEGATTLSDDRLPVIRAGSIQQSLLLDEGQIWIPAKKIKPNQMIRENDIVMCTSSGSSDLVGKCAKSTQDWAGSFGAFCAGIRADESKCSSSYLYHFLCSPHFRNWTKTSSGANIKNIRASELAAFEIPLPPLEEQKRIAAILDKADAIRRKRQQAIDLTDQLLRSVFLDMFGDPVTNPKGWPTHTLKNVIDLDNGRAFKSSEWGAEGLPIIRIQNLKKEEAEFNYYDGKYDQKHYVKNGDLLFSWSGQIVSFGAFIWNRDPGLLNQHIFNVRPKDNKFERLFLRFVMNSIIEIARNNFNGIEMKHLTKSELNEYSVIDPGISMQKKFAEIHNRIVKKSSTMKNSQIMLDELFSSITRKAFSGELARQTKAA